MVTITAHGVAPSREHPGDPMECEAWCVDCKAVTEMVGTYTGDSIECQSCGNHRPDVEQELRDEETTYWEGVAEARAEEKGYL